MVKEDENIHIHIIEEDYKRSKRKQEQQFEATGKADLTSQLMQNNENVMEKLQRMHPSFMVGSEPEEIQTEEESPQADTDYEKQLNSYGTSELSSSFQEMKTEENDLLNQKQNLLEKERELRGLLIQEISKKRKTIKKLESEVVELQNTCREIEQALEINITRE